MVQTAVARPLLWGVLMLWIAAFCRANNYDDGGGYFILDDGFPVSHLQQHLPATAVDATTATAEEYLCFKRSAGLHSMVAEGLTLSWNPTQVSAGSRLRMPTTLRGEGLWGEARPATRLSYGLSTGKRFWALQQEAGDERSSLQVEQPRFICRKRVIHRRCPPRAPPPEVPPPPPPEAVAPEAIRRSPPPPRLFDLASSS